MTHNFEREGWLKELGYTMISGLVYGASTVVVGHPLDTIKTNMQANEGMRLSMTQTINEIMRRDGPRGFYRGFIPPLVGQMVI